MLKYNTTPKNTPPVTLVKNYLSKNRKALILKESQKHEFQSPTVKVYGKEHCIPREQVWFADDGCNMVYSKLLVNASPWPYDLNRLRYQLKHDFKQDYNGVLVNRYLSGQQTMGWHSDDEPEIMLGTDIASISMGATRDFVVKNKVSNEKVTFTLSCGDSIIMHYPMQQQWLHSVPKRQKVVEPRLNFTFRVITPFFHV